MFTIYARSSDLPVETGFPFRYDAERAVMARYSVLSHYVSEQRSSPLRAPQHAPSDAHASNHLDDSPTTYAASDDYGSAIDAGASDCGSSSDGGCGE